MGKGSKISKYDLALRAVQLIDEDGYMKSVLMPKHKFYISDDDGNTKSIEVNKGYRDVRLNANDAKKVIDAMFVAMAEFLAKGDHIFIRGFGEFYMKYRAGRMVKLPGYDDPIEVKERYVPHFTFGEELRKSAALYEQKVEEDERARQAYISGEEELENYDIEDDYCEEESLATEGDD